MDGLTRRPAPQERNGPIRALTIVTALLTAYILTGPLPGADSKPRSAQLVNLQIDERRVRANEFRRALGHQTWPTSYSYRRTRSTAYRRWVLDLWESRAARARKWFWDDWRVQGFLCIHQGEGAWNANTGNGYYGGLQMDWSFQSSYGPEFLRSKGTANRWTPLEQIMVALRAHRTRSFYPWPTTARRCGLI